MNRIWELDFYSRPILDDRQKKVWEVLICESPQQTQQAPPDLFRYARYCSSQSVNSIFLRETLEAAIAAAGETPKRIRFFRRQMNNMILKACQDLGIPAVPSRRTYALEHWLQERSREVYPQESGYDASAASAASANYVQYDVQTAVRLPDAIRSDRRDKWAFVSLAGTDLADMPEWDVAFGEGFPLEMLAIEGDRRIPGLIIFSERALPMAGWMSGLELSAVQYQGGTYPQAVLVTGFGDRWVLADLTDSQTRAEAEGFEAAKRNVRDVHFLAIQSNPESESFAGFWLLKG